MAVLLVAPKRLSTRPQQHHKGILRLRRSGILCILVATIAGFFVLEIVLHNQFMEQQEQHQLSPPRVPQNQQLLSFQEASPVSTIKSRETNAKIEKIQMDILSVGSRVQPDLQAAQQKTFGRHPVVRHFYRATERDDSEDTCHADLTKSQLLDIWNHCEKVRKNRPVLKKIEAKLFHADFITQKARATAWQCAQKRPLDAFWNMIQKLQYSYAQNHTVPDYLWVVDDDTWLNLDRIVLFLQEYYPPGEPHAVTGCLLVQKAPFLFPVGGYGIVFTRAALQRWLQPLHCDNTTTTLLKEKEPSENNNNDDDSSDDDEQTWEAQACWRLKQSLMGEAPYFEKGMSVAALMHAYIQTHPFLHLETWPADSGFCVYSDMFWAYFVNFYHIAVPAKHSHKLFVPISLTGPAPPRNSKQPQQIMDFTHDRFVGYNGSQAAPWRRGDPSYYNGQCRHGIDFGKHAANVTRGDSLCNTAAHICHKITAQHMRTLYQQQRQQQNRIEPSFKGD